MRQSQTRDEWFAQKFSWLKRGALAFVIGLIVGVPLMMFENIGLHFVGGLILVIGAMWFFGLLVLIPILHWKDRYIGDRSTLWIILLVFESGWSVIFYWFRHVLLDRNASGRYAIDETS